LTREPKL
jgi:hypothetical protein